jgi:spore coat polysaccharide biosynthesis protein SpsF
MRIGAIIQARMGSGRLPGKVMASLGGRPLIQYALERAGRCPSLATVAVATSREGMDYPIVDLCRRLGVPCIRGPLEDVAERFRQAAEMLALDAFVRLCADSPLIDPALIERAVGIYLARSPDVVTNLHPRTFPHGQSVEVVARDVFEAAVPRMRRPEHREHVTRYFYDHADRYRIHNLKSTRDYGSLRLAVDTPEDLERLRELVGQFVRPHWEYRLDELPFLLPVAGAAAS